MGSNEGKSKSLSITPTISTGAYALGDQLGDLKELSEALDDSSGAGSVLSVSVVDKDSASAALEVLFFNSQPTVSSSDNLSLDISDAEMASKYLGMVKVATTDYISMAACSVASVRNVKLHVAGSKDGAVNPTGRSLWAVLRSAGTPTYSSTSSVVVKIGLVQD